MPELRRAGKPTLHYALDDYTDPWRDAPYLILQHGYGRSGRFWYSWVPYLSRFYKIVRPDLRGLGQSEAPDDLEAGLNVEAYIEDLLAIIDSLGGAPVHYCGESLGGILGMVLAAQHPERVRTLSLVAAPLLINHDTQRAFAFGHPSWQDALQAMGSRQWAEAANSATRFPAGTDPGLLAWYADEMGKSPRGGADPDVAHRIDGGRHALSRSHSHPDARPLSGARAGDDPVAGADVERSHCVRSRSSMFRRGIIRSRTSCPRRSPMKSCTLRRSTMASPAGSRKQCPISERNDGPSRLLPGLGAACAGRLPRRLRAGRKATRTGRSGSSCRFLPADRPMRSDAFSPIN